MLAELLLCGHVVFGTPLAPSPPPDLLLDTAETRQCEALSHFAWGLLSQFEESEAGLARADSQLRQALELAPDSQFVAEALVYPMLMRRDFGAVVEALLPAIQAAPEQDHLVLLAADALEAAEEPHKAIDLLERGLRAGHWRSGRLVRRLFVLLWEQGERKRAERLLARSGRRRHLRETFDYHYAAAYYARALGRQSAEEQASPRVLRKRQQATAEHARSAAHAATADDDAEEVATVAEMLIDAGEWETARDLLERLADEYDTPELWLLKARVLVHCGATRQAIAYLDELVVDYLPSESISEAAEILVNAGQTKAAARIVRRYLALDPDSLPARMELAWLQLELGQPSQGLFVLAPVSRLPTSGLLLTAYLHRKLGHHALALQAVERAMRQAKEDQLTEFLTPELHLFRSSLQEASGDLPAAIESARQAMAMAPDDAECANFLGYLLADGNRNLAEAEQLVRKALTEDGNNPAYLDSLAWALYRQARYPQAAAAIQQALDHGGDTDAVVLDHAGDIQAALGLHGLARVYWAEALAADPPDPMPIERKLQSAGGVDDHASRGYLPPSGRPRD